MGQKDLDRSYEGVIKAWFDYNHDTGEITWKEWVSPNWYKLEHYYQKFLARRAGRRVRFYPTFSDHLRVGAGGITCIFAHHIVWVLVYGKMPNHHIDHIDGNPENNIITNLRDVPREINMRNQKMKSNNSSGFTGVHWAEHANKWRARLRVDGKETQVGYYETLDEAVSARQDAIDKHPNLGFTERHGKKFTQVNKDGRNNENA